MIHLPLAFRFPLSLLAGVAALLFTASAAHASPARASRDFIEENLRFAAAQYDFMLQHVDPARGFPRSLEGCQLTFTAPHQWTSGFFPGSLWMLFEATGDEKWRKHAEEYTAALESTKAYERTHDLGFILYCSFGQGWRLTKNPKYREVLLEGAQTLGSRFDERVGAIKSWDDTKWAFPVIIDNMMNLELLTWAGSHGGPQRLGQIAVRHANTALRDHFRPDGSSFHVVSYVPDSGKVASQETHQGCADSSSWARGQAWALYGFTMMYRETRIETYRVQALRVAHFIRTHPRLPEDGVPYWDFDAPGIPNEPRDSSAAAIMASALLELATFVDADDARELRDLAERQLLSLGSESYRAKVGENGGFLLRHGTGNHPKHSEIDVPLVYGDYYFIEALVRAKNMLPARGR
ncbi:MAG: glycoside hydrolase family 88 protein [Opitutaceae bacterium]|nr:glycoside hydrolase family 88 protein [Opitutaceae bacterium]